MKKIKKISAVLVVFGLFLVVYAMYPGIFSLETAVVVEPAWELIYTMEGKTDEVIHDQSYVKLFALGTTDHFVGNDTNIKVTFEHSWHTNFTSNGKASWRVWDSYNNLVYSLNENSTNVDTCSYGTVNELDSPWWSGAHWEVEFDNNVNRTVNCCWRLNVYSKNT